MTIAQWDNEIHDPEIVRPIQLLLDPVWRDQAAHEQLDYTACCAMNVLLVLFRDAFCASFVTGTRTRSAIDEYTLARIDSSIKLLYDGCLEYEDVFLKRARAWVRSNGDMFEDDPAICELLQEPIPPGHKDRHIRIALELPVGRTPMRDETDMD